MVLVGSPTHWWKRSMGVLPQWDDFCFTQPDENCAYVVPNFINGTRKNLKDLPVKMGCRGGWVQKRWQEMWHYWKGWKWGFGGGGEDRTLRTLYIDNVLGIIFYYEQQIKRELKRIYICGCRYNERLKAKTDGSTCLTYTGFRGELEHLKIETRLIGESFETYTGNRVRGRLFFLWTTDKVRSKGNTCSHVEMTG